MISGSFTRVGVVRPAIKTLASPRTFPFEVSRMHANRPALGLLCSIVSLWWTAAAALVPGKAA